MAVKKVIAVSTRLLKQGSWPWVAFAVQGHSLFKSRNMPNNIQSNYPKLGYGMGLRASHYPYILEHWPKIDWFEIISENFMESDGKPKRVLEQIKERYPIVMHGVSMSIGTVDPLNSDYLAKLKKLANWLDTPWVSDHLCWTGIAHQNTHDLLPVPYTEEALKHIINRIEQVQDYLERPLLIENPSTYLEFAESEISEAEFIATMAEESGCGLLLDANNVYVSCYNHRLDPKAYIDALPANKVAQIHLAGHSNNGTHIVDTHDDCVVDEVWELYRYIISKTGEVSTMVEWDAKIPEFEVVQAEIGKAKTHLERNDPINFPKIALNNYSIDAKKTSYEDKLKLMHGTILNGDAQTSKPDTWIIPKPEFSPSKQLDVYINSYRYRLFDTIDEDYHALRAYLGKEKMDKTIDDFIEQTPSKYFNISNYIIEFPEYVKEVCDDAAYEICQLETAISLLFDAAETKPLSPDALAGFDAEMIDEMLLHPRTALKLFEFKYEINKFYQDVMDAKYPGNLIKNPSYVVVYRHQDSMWRLDLDEKEYQLLQKLFSGNNIGAAMEIVINDEDEADISSWFAKWMQNGLLAEV